MDEGKGGAVLRRADKVPGEVDLLAIPPDAKAIDFAARAVYVAKKLDGTPLVVWLSPVIFLVILASHLLWLYFVDGERNGKLIMATLVFLGSFAMANLVYFAPREYHTNPNFHVLRYIIAVCVVATIGFAVYVTYHSNMRFTDACVCIRDCIVMYALAGVFCVFIRSITDKNETDAIVRICKKRGYVSVNPFSMIMPPKTLKIWDNEREGHMMTRSKVQQGYAMIERDLCKEEDHAKSEWTMVIAGKMTPHACCWIVRTKLLRPSVVKWLGTNHEDPAAAQQWDKIRGAGIMSDRLRCSFVQNFLFTERTDL